MDDKKTIEKECLLKTQKYLARSSKATKRVLDILSGEVIESERPDFIIKNSSGVIGVEHFLIDTLIGRKRHREAESENRN